MSSIRLVPLVAAALLVAGLAHAKPQKPMPLSVQTTDAGAVPVTVKMDELKICETADCYFWIAESFKDDGKFRFGTIDGQGNWALFDKNEHYSAKHKDENDNVAPCSEHTEETKTAAEDEEDEEEEEEADEDATPDESWKDKPILSVEERRKRYFDRNVRKAFCNETASGTLAGDGNERTFEIAATDLPEGDYLIYSNGWFGAYLNAVEGDSPVLKQLGKETLHGAYKIVGR